MNEWWLMAGMGGKNGGMLPGVTKCCGKQEYQNE